MTYFVDLSEYAYDLDRPVSNARNVGWLDSRHAFMKGTVPLELIVKLNGLAIRKSVNQMRGFHYCQFCDEEDVVVNEGDAASLLGSAEIWVPAQDGKSYYASPDLIIHYIEKHGYRPPDEYLEALTALDVERWNPSDIERTVRDLEQP